MVDPPNSLSQKLSLGGDVRESAVRDFLDRAYNERGAHSVIYISFGTIFFPKSDSIGHLNIILEEILSQGFRLIFTQSSAAAKSTGLNAAIFEKAVTSKQAIFPQWTNQAEVLEHPVSRKSLICWFMLTCFLLKGYTLFSITRWMELYYRVHCPGCTDDILAVYC